MPIPTWLQYADPGLAPYGRSSTTCFGSPRWPRSGNGWGEGWQRVDDGRNLRPAPQARRASAIRPPPSRGQDVVAGGFQPLAGVGRAPGLRQGFKSLATPCHPLEGRGWRRHQPPQGHTDSAEGTQGCRPGLQAGGRRPLHDPRALKGRRTGWPPSSAVAAVIPCKVGSWKVGGTSFGGSLRGKSTALLGWWRSLDTDLTAAP